MATSGEAILSLLHVSDEKIVHSPEWYRELQDAINNLITNDFAKLVQVLYRVDVSEQKLKSLLHQNPGSNAATIITDLILERQLQKIKARNSFTPGESNIPPDEKW